MAGPTRLELATSCVTGKKSGFCNHPTFNLCSENTRLSLAGRVCLAVAGCGRMLVGSLQKSLQRFFPGEDPWKPHLLRPRNALGLFLRSTAGNCLPGIGKADYTEKAFGWGSKEVPLLKKIGGQRPTGSASLQNSVGSGRSLAGKLAELRLRRNRADNAARYVAEPHVLCQQGQGEETATSRRALVNGMPRPHVAANGEKPISLSCLWGMHTPVDKWRHTAGEADTRRLASPPSQPLSRATFVMGMLGVVMPVGDFAFF